MLSFFILDIKLTPVVLVLVLDRCGTVGTKMNSIQNKSPHNSVKHEDLF